MDMRPREESTTHLDEWLFGGLAALSAAVMTQIVETPTSLQSYLGAGVTCFAVALPLLAFSLLVSKALPNSRQQRGPLRILVDVGGILMAIIGFAFVFLHVNVVSGVVFVGTAFLAVLGFIVSVRSHS